jgi:hypothetical protein
MQENRQIYRRINMDKGLDIKDSDVFFSMRGSFWVESRDRALAEKERNEPFSQKSQEARELGQSPERDKRQVVCPDLAPSPAIGTS